MSVRRVIRAGVRIFVRLLAAAVVVAVIAALAGLVVVQSGWFHEYVRARIIAELEHSTGARVELGRFSFRGATLTAQVTPLVLHGKEPAGEPPLLRLESIALRLRIISLFERKVDLAAVNVSKPRVRIVTYPDSSTNLPNPAQHFDGTIWVKEMIHLAVREYQVSDGLLEIDNRTIPLSLSGDGLELRMTYDAHTPSYHGELDSRWLRVMTQDFAPVEAGLSAKFELEPARMWFSRLRLYTKESRAELTGELRDLREPQGSFALKATSAIREAARFFPIPLEPTGSASFEGKLTIAFAKQFQFAITGRMAARGLGYTRDRIKLEGADVRADVNLGFDHLRMANIQASALNASFAGSADLEHWRDLRVEGKVDGVTLEQAAKPATDHVLPWNGILAGDVALETALGQPDLKVRADLALSPAPASKPIEGHVKASYDQAAGDLSIEPSYFATSATRADASGTLDKALQIRFRSTNLDEVLPALALLDPQAPHELPLKLDKGAAEAAGRLTGRLEQARFQGQVSVTNGVVEGHSFNKFTADLTADRDTVSASRFTLIRGATEVSGSGSVAAQAGNFENASLDGQISLKNANLQELAEVAGSSIAVTGTASATLRVSGSVRAPQAEISLDLQKPAAFGERLDRLRASIRMAPASVEVSGGDAQAGPGRLRFSGDYRHASDNWKAGEVSFQLAAQNLPAARIEAVANLQPPVDARLNTDLRLRGRIQNGQFQLVSADGDLAVQAVVLNKEPVGEFSISGATSGSAVSLKTRGKLMEASFDGQGSWKLEGDEPGSADVQFSRMSVDSFHRLMILAGAAPREDEAGLPFEGFMQGRASVSVPLLHLGDAQAQVTLDTVQLNPRSAQTLKLGVQVQDLVVRNSQPVKVLLNTQEARIQSALFTARNTSIEASGSVPFSGTGADLAVRGSINLVILQLLNPNLLAQGNASVQASLRGSLRDPALNGRMELKSASLYLNDIPNGVDNVNGAVLFDRNRATIEKLAGETGGGTMSFAGFIEFGSLLTYRLQAQASQIRVRWPEDLSTIFNANLALNGTSDASTVTGTLTLDRAALTLRSDLIQLLSAAAKPVPAPSSPSDYLRGMQFNVQVQSAPNFGLETSLTRDVEAAVDLRLRGTPLRPVLLGTIDVSQGQVEMFGNTYSIDRGNIRFLNPVKIEPTFDVQLQTKARGVAVTVSFSGTTQKVNFNYSSDPPLQQSEIIALLAVGRSPNFNAGLASAQPSSASENFMEAGGGLISQAVSDQLSSRFQRFFGSSRVKIDPTMTGVDNLPQARLTWEQQVSRDITLTYITNLNRTQEQIVRVEWDLDRSWSAVAVRDANGLFGIDFQYRKRFK